MLTDFLGPVAARDSEIVESWRQASPAAHAQAMIELSRYAEQMVLQTGIGKGSDDIFPGFPSIHPAVSRRQ